MADEKLTPHHYHPSFLHMGDCSICGNIPSHPIHCTAGGGSAPSEPHFFRTGGGGGQTVIPAVSGDAGPRPVGERVLLDQIDELKGTIRSLSADNEQLMDTIADMKIADDGTVEEERDALRQRVAELERRPGHSKLVYDKGKRTIVTVRDDDGFATECPACPHPTTMHDYDASPCDVAALNARIAELENSLTLSHAARRIAELESHLSAAHVRITCLETDRDDWKSTAFNRYNEIEQKNERVAELEAACARKGNELCVQSQELAKLEGEQDGYEILVKQLRARIAELEAAHNAKPTVAAINYQDATFADEQTRSLGFEPRYLQLAWRNNPPPYGQETAGRSWHWVCEQAIIDALIHEGIPAWHGDAVSCVAQIVEAYAKRLAELEKKLEAERSLAANIIGQYERGSALRACLTLTPSLMDGEQAKARLREINSYIYSVLPSGENAK